MELKAGTTRWFESGPNAILSDPELATLIGRRFDTRALAMQWAEQEQKAIEDAS